MNDGAAVGRPSEFDSFVLLHLHSLHIAGNAPIFDAEIKAARFGSLGQTIASTPSGYHRRSDSNTYPLHSCITTAHAPLSRLPRVASIIFFHKTQHPGDLQ
jgi:hypothetical protein